MVKLSCHLGIVAAVFFALFIFLPAQAENKIIGGGVVHFHGAVVEPVCEVATVAGSRQVGVDCSMRSDADSKMPPAIFVMQLRYLDDDRDLAIADITYH